MSASTILAVARHAASPTALIVILIVAGSIAAAGYAVACWIWPFANCPRCHGSGKHRSPSGRAFRRCRRCKGTGARLRTGRRVANYFQGKRDRS